MTLHRKVDVCGAKKLWVKASMLSPQPVFERLPIVIVVAMTLQTGFWSTPTTKDVIGWTLVSSGQT
jgi:hypothetical protein